MSAFVAVCRRLLIAALALYLVLMAAILTAGEVLQLQPHNVDCYVVQAGELFCYSVPQP